MSGAKENVLELGGRIILDKFYKFSISGEIVNRIYLKGENKKSKLRYTINLSYEIFKNKLLTFNIGKDFDMKPVTGGNLIAALNLILGFGAERNVLGF